MASSYSVSTIFNARDRMSPAFKRMGRSASMFGSMLRANLMSNVISGGIRMLTNGIRNITMEFIDFEGALTSSTAKFGDLNRFTEEGQRQMEQLGMVARRVGQTTIFSATEAAQGLDFLAMAGFTATEAMEALPRVTDLAVVAQTDLATATDMASDSLGAFGLEVSDMQRLNDVFARTMTTSNTNMMDMFEAVKNGAPAFTTAGQSMESFNALLGVMANSGVKGAQAGTALRNIMLRLANPTAEAARVMTDLGIQTQDQHGNFLDVVDIIGQFENSLKSMGTAQRSAALSTVFGARTVTGMNLLLQEGADGLAAYRDQLLGAAGASSEMAGVIGSSLGNRLKGLKSAVIEAGFTFVSAFSDVAGSSIDMLTEMVRNVDLTAMAERVAAFVQKIIDNIPVIVQYVKDLIPKFQEVGAQILAIVEGLARLFGFGRGEFDYAAAGAQRPENRYAQMSQQPPNAREAEARQQIDANIYVAFQNARMAEMRVETQGMAASNVRKEELGAAP